MTTLEVTNKLFEFFQENDSFSITDNFKNIIPIHENIEQERELVRLGLKKLTEAKILSERMIIKEKLKDSSSLQFKEIWFLEKPLNQFDQNITISGPTANAISNIMNEVSKEQISSSMNLTEKDIQGLIFIINGLLKANQEQQSD